MSSGTMQRESIGRSGLTNAQQLIWASQLIHPDAPLYNMAFLFEIHGEVVADDFVRAFQHLVEQCDALRTVVESIDGVPGQRVLETVDFELPVVDFSVADNPDEACRTWAKARCETPLAIDHQTFDSALVRLGSGRWSWYFNQHHLVTDAWSSAVIYGRMEALYRSVRGDDGGPEAPLPPYAEYLKFEAESASETLDNSGTAEPVDAPSLYGRRPRSASTENARLSYELSDTQSQQLRELATRPELRALTPDLGLFRLIATALFAFLHRVSGQSTIAIGAPAHNRATAEFRNTAGLFMEMYPLGVELADDETFRSLHAKVIPAADAMMRRARPGGSSAEVNRAINVVLNFIRGSFGRFDGSPVQARWLHPGHVDSEHHLRLQVHDFNETGRLTLLFDCNKQVLDGALREAVPGQFMRMLDAMLKNLEAPISTVDLLSETESRAVTATVNSNVPAAVDVSDVVSRFCSRAAAQPDAVALISGGERWSFAELDQITSRVAGGIVPGSVVGICLGRSREAVMTMLGILKAGAAYVPIDPKWPTSRIEYVAHDAGCSLVVGDDRLELTAPTVGFADLAGGGEPAEPLSRIESGDLAYILYTSGSTGRPKGVMVEHGSLANYMNWATTFYDRGRQLTFPLFTPLSFDLTLTSIFVPLTSGGSIKVYPETDSPTDLTVRQVFEDDAVDIVKLTPSHLALLPDRDYSTARIQQLILGGEDLTTAMARRVDERFGGRVLIHNEYGPTEATVGCVVHTYDPAADNEASVPIGRPIPNMRAYVLDAAQQPVPYGVPGELCVSGPGVARGYAGRPELTKERFVSSTTLGEKRLYTTGDLARIRPSGTIEYLGRRDDQVKIRGARVELGEVEAALADHPQVIAAAARVWQRTAAPVVEDGVFCSRCGLASDYPGVSFDGERICNQCRSYETYRDKAMVYFKPMEELQAVFSPTAANAEYDCLALLSGGKDSTYALCRLVDMDLRVLAFTLDNGYISEQAKGNIRRVVEHLGVDHVFASTPAMNEIFVDSLQRHSNVCQGCFKTIYTLSLQVAREKSIPFIVTGLSRGQFFETRLTEDLFTQLTVSSGEIDAAVLEARKAYHQVDDAVRSFLDVSIFDDDQILEDVEFVDFYRYCDVGIDEMMAYLDERVPWVRPSDTGRSTNCRINDVGIYFHRLTRGFHNYALPYSWDVRMGHKTRDESLTELEDDIDVAEVQRILQEIGYPEDVAAVESGLRLVGYYGAPDEIPVPELRKHVAETLPDQMIPSQFVRLDAIPLTPNGKVDREALPEPGGSRPAVDTVFLAPRTDTEIALARTWEQVLGIDQVGIRDNFFDLGGDSIMAIQIVARSQRAGLPITLRELFETLTVERLVQAADAALMEVSAETPDASGRPAPTPAPGLADLDRDELGRLAALLSADEEER